MSYQHYAETKAIELQKRFLEFDQVGQGLIIVAAAHFLKVKKVDVLYRIYSMSNPLCTIGYSQDEVPQYCRVEEGEVNKPFKVLMANYLHEAQPKSKGGKQ